MPDKLEKQQAMINALKNWLPQCCSAEMIWPDQHIWCIEVYSPSLRRDKGFEAKGTHRFFGRGVADTASMRVPQYQKFINLTDRPILGPTTLETDLAFMMANMAGVARGSFVIDPFVGTGGILIPCSVIGAEVFGADMDIRVLKGYGIAQLNRKYANIKKVNKSNKEGFSQTDKTQRSDIYVNFEAYGLPKPNIFRTDITKSCYRSNLKFDMIVTDPPYGIRAPSRVIKGVSNSGTAVTNAVSWEYIYQTLIKFAGNYLVERGRLCFLLPCPSFDAHQGMDKIKTWGDEAGLELLNVCYQRLQTMGRNIVCMEKKIKLQAVEQVAKNGVR